MIFPGSEASPPWPLTADDLRQRTDAAMAAIGGWDAVLGLPRAGLKSPSGLPLVEQAAGG